MRTCPLLSIVLALALIALGPGSAPAEPLPTQGTFEGVYHKDRWGRARISFFVIPKALQPRFAPYEGRRIRFEVTIAEQPMIPGDVVVQEIGTIELLEAAPDLAVGIHRTAGGPADAWLVSLTNRGDEPVTVSQEILQLSFWRRTTLRGSTASSPRKAHAERAWSRRVDEGAPRITIPAGARYAFPFTLRVDDPLSELEAWYVHSIEGVRCPYRRWLRVDEEIPELAPATLRLENAEVRHVDRPFAPRLRQGEGTYVLSGRLRSETEDALFPMFRHEDVACVPMRLRAYDAKGRPVAVRSVDLCDDGRSTRGRWSGQEPHRLAGLPGGGFPVEIHFQHRSRFPDVPITRLELEVLGASGISRVPVAIAFRDTLRAEPPAWGPAAHGVRIRARALPVRGKGRMPDFVLEAVNDAGTPRMLFTGQEGGGGITLVIDGTPVPLPRGRYVLGWAVDHVCDQRDEYTLSMPSSVHLEPGRHTVQVVIQGPGGTWANANRDLVPVLDGEVRTAVTSFVVR